MKEKSFYLKFVFALIANIYKWKVYCYIWVANEKRGIMQKKLKENRCMKNIYSFILSERKNVYWTNCCSVVSLKLKICKLEKRIKENYNSIERWLSENSKFFAY